MKIVCFMYRVSRRWTWDLSPPGAPCRTSRSSSWRPPRATCSPIPGRRCAPRMTLPTFPPRPTCCWCRAARCRRSRRCRTTPCWTPSRGRARGAAWVTSVCTGALLLGAAGLLRGYRSASHWTARHYLDQFGAIPDAARVVIDRNRASGGGVTAGIDFGLSMIRHWRGEETSKLIELVLEYAPEPPNACGRPELADAATLAQARALTGPMMPAELVRARRGGVVSWRVEPAAGACAGGARWRAARRLPRARCRLRFDIQTFRIRVFPVPPIFSNLYDDPIT